MLSIPVRSKVSYWTSLGNSNVLKRNIEKKRKPLTPWPRVLPARCMVVSHVPLLLVVCPCLIRRLVLLPSVLPVL